MAPPFTRRGTRQTRCRVSGVCTRSQRADSPRVWRQARVRTGVLEVSLAARGAHRQASPEAHALTRRSLLTRHGTCQLWPRYIRRGAFSSRISLFCLVMAPLFLPIFGRRCSRRASRHTALHRGRRTLPGAPEWARPNRQLGSRSCDRGLANRGASTRDTLRTHCSGPTACLRPSAQAPRPRLSFRSDHCRALPPKCYHDRRPPFPLAFGGGQSR